MKGLKMMMKKLCLILLILMALTGICLAETLEFQLEAGSKSLSGGAHYRTDLVQGFVKVGIKGVYTDDDDTQYKWGGVRVVVGNDTMVEGLSCEVGVVGLYGDAEDGNRSGDVGALAFAIQGNYLFPERMLPIPIEVFSSINYSPDLMSFADTKSYAEFNLGLGVQVIQNASVILTYTKYKVEMEEGPGDWNLDEDVLRAGIVLRF
jgi:hypothetical protein